jgi:hypothetical protein
MIRLFFIRTIALLFLTSTFLVAAQLDQTDDAAAVSTSQTPHRPVPVEEVEQTPGQQLCQRQAITLTRENFISVLEPKVVDSWGVNWAVFQDESLPFDNPSKRQCIRLIANQMKMLSVTKQNGALRSLYLETLGLQGDAEAVHSTRLDNLALAYFHNRFPNASLTPKSKRDGVQLGERIIVERAGQPVLTYHVKTHSAGRLSSNSTAAKLVNPQELMAYRVLEHLGIGCQSHFFERSPEDVYIATLDAGAGGSFCLFEVMSGHLGRGGDEGVGYHFAGSLMDIPQDTARHDHNAIERTVEVDPVAQNFIDQMVSLDVITRIFRLHDLLNNPGNFGFFESTTQAPSIRVIDFRIMDREIFEMDWRDFGGFLVGNGFYQYAGSHKTMRYVIHDRQRQLRVEAARSIMERGLVESLRRAVEQAHQDVLVYLSQDVFVPCHEDLMPKIREYYQASLHNINFFWEELQQWTLEADAAREAEHEKYRRGSTMQ